MIEHEKRPYAASANVIAVLQRARTRNLPEVIDNEFLKIVGIGPAVFGRVVAAMEFLGLITEGDGRPTDKLRALSAAPEAEYRELFAGILRDAYADDFALINPGEDTQAQIIDRFRRYQPRSQASRMVMLLLGLCKEAGIPVRDVPRERGMQGSAARPKTLPRKATHRSGPARQGEAAQRGAPAPHTGLQIAGVTEADFAALNEDEFSEVWAALGTVVKRVTRARGRAAQPTATETGSEDQAVDPKGGDA